ncbi:hypothetical protein ACFWB2_14610 [Streptomyces virginiae]|uniref:hypothetical protein n=1 Tax=Streptomyces virginiae TaxID=1961 RepID=UPI0036810F65
MTKQFPDPPHYPPYSAWSDPTIHVTVTQEPPEEHHWNFSWLQIGKNLGAASCAFVPANLWASALHDVEHQQSAHGAWFMGGALLTVTLIRFVQGRGFFNRTVLWIAVLGLFLALPVFSTVVDVMTGGGR